MMGIATNVLVRYIVKDDPSRRQKLRGASRSGVHATGPAG